jgi:serine/threonine protein kinase
MLPPATIPGRIEPDMFSSEDKNDAHDAMSSDANLKPEEVVEDVAWLVIEAIGGALHFMHERGVAHLDVRPANIFIAHRAGPIADEEFLHNQKSTLRCSEEKVGRSRQNSRDSDASLEWDTCAKCVARKLLDNSCTLKLGDFGHTVQAPAGSSSSSSSSSGKVASSHSSNPDSHVNSNAMNTGSDGVDNGGTGSRVAQSHGEVEEGETRYCARELIDRNGSGIDLQKCDIFSLGASVYELGLGRELSDSSDSKTTAIAVATAAAAAAGPTRSPARSGNASPLKQSMSLDSFSMSPPPNQISPPDVAEEWHNLRNGIFHERIRDGSVFGEDLLALLTSVRRYLCWPIRNMHTSNACANDVYMRSISLLYSYMCKDVCLYAWIYSYIYVCIHATSEFSQCACISLS